MSEERHLMRASVSNALLDVVVEDDTLNTLWYSLGNIFKSNELLSSYKSGKLLLLFFIERNND